MSLCFIFIPILTKNDVFRLFTSAGLFTSKIQDSVKPSNNQCDESYYVFLSLKKSFLLSLPVAQQLNLNRQRCRYLPNGTFTCDLALERDPAQWENHKLRLDQMIEETRKRLRNLKVSSVCTRWSKRPGNDYATWRWVLFVQT